MQKHFAFQSTLEILKNPAKTYASKAIDLLGGLEGIAKKKYKSQLELDVDVCRLVMSAYDGHVNIIPTSLNVFQFSRQNASLVSISKDGLALPELYLRTDISSHGESANISSIKSIDGKDALQYVEEVATSTQGYPDPDARWNSTMYSKALITSPTLSLPASCGQE